MKINGNFFQKNIKSEELFFLELFILPCFVVLDIIFIRVFLVFLYLFFAKLNEKRINYTYFFIMFFSIVFFSLLSAKGQILFSYKFIKITKGSLFEGINRALLLIGFVFISLFCVQKDLNIPSKIGRLLSDMLIYYQLILDKKRNRIKKENLINDIDTFLEEIYYSNFHTKLKIERRTSAKGYYFMLFVILLNITLLAYKYLFL